MNIEITDDILHLLEYAKAMKINFKKEAINE